MEDWPLVLAGPLVRNLQPPDVSVWVALHEPRDVRLHIWQGPVDTGPGTGVHPPDGSIGTASASTVRVGDGLHVALVTLRLEPPAAFQPGLVYSYNLTFSATGVGAAPESDLRSEGLLSDTDPGDEEIHPHLALGYLDAHLPAFEVAPLALDDLRLVHASCLSIKSDSSNALPILDQMLEDAVVSGSPRPHQLFLTGDQIYADEVPTALLHGVLGRNAPRLIGADGEGEVAEPRENLPLGPVIEPASITSFPPALRRTLVNDHAKFSTDDGRDHLLSLGEFCAMYLASWSNVTWPTRPHTKIRRKLADIVESLLPATAPDPDHPVLERFVEHFVPRSERKDENDDPFPTPGANIERFGARLLGLFDAGTKSRERYVNGRRATLAFYRSLPRVRRALANVPTWMMFDDHEVTDDWYITRRWRREVHQSHIGRIVVRNALLAYALFQDWGNSPERYASAGSPQERLLAIASEYVPPDERGPVTAQAGRTDDTEPARRADTILGLVEGPVPPEIDWHYTVVGPRHRVIVLDTRTRRGYRSEESPPALIAPESLELQIPDEEPPAHVEVTFVLSPAPVLGPPVLEEMVQPLGFRIRNILKVKEELEEPEEGLRDFDPGALALEPEAWSFDPQALEALLARLAPMGRVVFLSGDVHFSLTMALDYWLHTTEREYRREVAGETPVERETRVARMVQLTSSSLRKQEPDALVSVLGSRGGQWLLGEALQPWARFGWHEARAEHWVTVPAENRAALPMAYRVRLQESPVLVGAHGWPAGTQMRERHWEWQLHAVADRRPDVDGPRSRPAPGRVERIADQEPLDHVERHRAAVRLHSRSVERVASRKIVFETNLAEVGFTRDEPGEGEDPPPPPSERLRVHHRILYRLAGKPAEGVQPYTVHSPSLAPAGPDDVPQPRIAGSQLDPDPPAPEGPSS